MEKDMRNYRKRLSMGASVIGSTAYQMAAAVLAQFAAGTLADRPMSALPVEPFRVGKMPAWALTPAHRHGCNKRGGPSKRRRNLNYWRRR